MVYIWLKLFVLVFEAGTGGLVHAVPVSSFTFSLCYGVYPVSAFGVGFIDYRLRWVFANFVFPCLVCHMHRSFLPLPVQPHVPFAIIVVPVPCRRRTVFNVIVRTGIRFVTLFGNQGDTTGILLVITSGRRSKDKFLRLAKRQIKMAPGQEVTHLGRDTFIVDESHKTLIKVIQEM